MRTTQAARYARWSAAVAILLAVIVGGVYASRAWQARREQRATKSRVPPSVHQQTAEFSLSKVTGDHTQFTVRASRAVEFAEGGRSLLEDVWVTAYGKDGQRFDNLHTHACDYVESTGNITCGGDVQIDLESASDVHAKPHSAPSGSTPGGDAPSASTPANGASERLFHVSTTNVSFNRESGLATGDHPVALEFPQGEGRGVGFRYDATMGELSLTHSVEMTFHAAAGTPNETANPLLITGEGLTYSRDARVVHLLGPVSVRRGTYQLTAGTLDLELNEALHPQKIIASNHPVMHDAAFRGALSHGTRQGPGSGAASASASAPGGEPVTLSADELSAMVMADGSVRHMTGVGNVHLDSTAAAGGNRLDAGRAEIELDAAGQMRRMTATENVVLDSTRPGGAKQRLTTSQLNLDFAAGPGGRVHMARAVTPASIVEMEDQVQAVAQAPARAARAPVQMVARRMRLASDHLESTFGDTNEVEALHGAGNVRIERQMGSAPAETSTSQDFVAHFAPTGEWSTVDQTGGVTLQAGDRTARGDAARFDRLANTAALSGNVALAEPGSSTTAQSATLDPSGEFHAKGRVVTSEIASSGPRVTDFAPGPARISANSLTANTATGHAVYSGQARLWQGDTVIEADTIDLDRSASALNASTHVHAVFPQAAWTPPGGAPATRHGEDEYWHADADRMTYQSDTGRGRLEQNVSVHSSEGAIRSDSMDLFFAPGQSANTANAASAANAKTALPEGKALAGVALKPVSQQDRPADSESGARTAGQQLVRATALGRVTIDQQDRRGTGSRADYTAADGKFVLSGGSPTVHDGSGNSVTGRQLTLFFADDRIVVDSAEGMRTLTLHRVEK